MIKEALSIEKMFSENDYKGCVTFDGFMLERGDRSILILATHSVRSMVDGEITEPERFTGAMAILLARLSGASSMTKVTFGEDVDLIKDNEFKSYTISFTKMNNPLKMRRKIFAPVLKAAFAVLFSVYEACS